MSHQIFLRASFSQNKNEFGAVVLISFQGSYPISGFFPQHFTRDQEHVQYNKSITGSRYCTKGLNFEKYRDIHIKNQDEDKNTNFKKRKRALLTYLEIWLPFLKRKQKWDCLCQQEESQKWRKELAQVWCQARKTGLVL